MSAFTLRVLSVLDNYPSITYDVYVVQHPEFASDGDTYETAVLGAVQRIVAAHPRCTINIETVDDFAPFIPALQVYTREQLNSQTPANVLAHVIAELRLAHALQLVKYLEERRDLGQLGEKWQVQMIINKLAHIAALS